MIMSSMKKINIKHIKTYIDFKGTSTFMLNYSSIISAAVEYSLKSKEFGLTQKKKARLNMFFYKCGNKFCCSPACPSSSVGNACHCGTNKSSAKTSSGTTMLKITYDGVTGKERYQYTVPRRNDYVFSKYPH